MRKKQLIKKLQEKDDYIRHIDRIRCDTVQDYIVLVRELEATIAELRGALGLRDGDRVGEVHLVLKR